MTVSHTIIRMLILLVNLPYVDTISKNFSLKDMKDHSIRDTKPKLALIIKPNASVGTNNKQLQPNSARIPRELHLLQSEEISSPEVKTARSIRSSKPKQDEIRAPETFSDSIGQLAKLNIAKVQKPEGITPSMSSTPLLTELKAQSKKSPRKREGQIKSPIRSKSPVKTMNLVKSTSQLKIERKEKNKLDPLYQLYLK